MTTWPDPPTYDTAFTDIVRGIRIAIEQYQGTSLRRSLKGSLIWNVPFHRNPFFTGRDAVLQSLHDALTKESTAVLTHSLTKAISGLGGIGKTQTALEYAYRYRDEYRAVLWAKADSREALSADFVSIASLLQLTEQVTQEQHLAIAAVKLWLAYNTDWLLILDNVEDLSIIWEYIPTASNSHILLTTRSTPTGSIAQRIEPDTMKPDDGALLLLRRAGILPPGASSNKVSATDRTKALHLVQELGGLPLAIDQAGAYLEEMGSSLSHYLHLSPDTSKSLSSDAPACQQSSMPLTSCRYHLDVLLSAGSTRKSCRRRPFTLLCFSVPRCHP